MPIKGLTTGREAAFPRIGILRKGGEKQINKSGQEVYGKDLTFFRFDSNDAQAVADFEQAYGKEPAAINVYLPFVTPDENFQAWQEEYKAGGLVHRCDGETMTVHLTPDGKYSTEPKPCPYHAGTTQRNKKEPGCKPTGRLTVIIPELRRFAYVTSLTNSKNDIMELTDNLNAVYAMRGTLQGIPFRLVRRPRMISTPTPDGGRARREKWMLSLEVNPDWAVMQLESMQKQAMLPIGAKMLTDGRAVTQDGEIMDDDGDDYWETDEAPAPVQMADIYPPADPADDSAWGNEAQDDNPFAGLQLSNATAGFVDKCRTYHAESDGPCTEAMYKYLVGTINYTTEKDAHTAILAELVGRPVDSENRPGFTLTKKLLDTLPATKRNKETKEDEPNQDHVPAILAAVKEIWKATKA